ncbi:putative inositol 5-phosphatase [Aspergillus nomiae NRRL 13137]|uniref:Putative inositol 5-phosphatase n=1 Tax=Aspergillus nomiae NRRL (strain ATCC 15546 / NRRL 13137 / CBS 260.88 / M93) TaxID=1509407 RepID=A0A0L1IX70_ASPN3|nr:putative inositol 5-phosphatase [Aspergillus nomiae NRRL 13137]KNG84087.1 putative inositol 5-phosphatase [Aspergillus nomiae NRRL 13137]
MESLTLYMLTFNCARNPVDVNRFAHHFFDALPLTDSSSASTPPDLIVLSLQEIAPIAYAFLGGSFLAPYFASLSEVVELAVAKRWETHYVNMVTDNSGMTGLMVYARSDVAERISSIDTARVGFGFQQMGNKGAVGARLTYATQKTPGDTVDLTFIAAHLAPMEYAVRQRNEDWRSMVERLVFDRVTARAGENTETGGDSESTALLSGSTRSSGDDYRGIFIPTSYLFLAGDLNYRTSNASPRSEDCARFPQAEVDPADPRHFSHLLKEDQLTREMRQSRSFHGLSEAPITFPPTYKYTNAARQAAARGGGSQEWLWTSTRWPSWCDRVLYLETLPGLGEEARVRPLKYNSLPLFPTSDHRAVALSASVPVPPRRSADATQSAIPFRIDPEWASKRDAARRKELVVGCLAYLGLTWEGNGLLVASVIGVLGAWLVLRSLFNA